MSYKDQVSLSMENQHYDELIALLKESEDVLMAGILKYASEHGYTKYTSTLKEAWRLSISGLSSSIATIVSAHGEPPSLQAEDDLLEHQAAHFGILEARRHRQRGISLNMFFGLLKYYRKTYIDLLKEHEASLSNGPKHRELIHRVFDIIETGLCVEWAGGGEQKKILEMQISNREMTNEKNKYLTIFESIPTPVFLITPDGMIDNMNLAASAFLHKESIAGGQYYGARGTKGYKDSKVEESSGMFRGRPAVDVLPWFATEINTSLDGTISDEAIEKRIELDGEPAVFRMRFSQMLDVSSKFTGSIFILENITTLKNVQSEVIALKGLIPICAHCKNMRDDEGYWSRLEEYIEKRSEAYFSHSICNECLSRYYDLD